MGYKAQQKTRSVMIVTLNLSRQLKPYFVKYKRKGITKHIVFPPSKPAILMGKLKS